METPRLVKLAVLIGSSVSLLLHTPEPPKLKDEYWGPGVQPKNRDTSIRPFNIAFFDAMINDLRFRLNNTRKVQPSFEGADWDYGMNSKFVPVILDYWLNNYDFQKAERRLNQYPQYVTNVQGLDIHYIHVRPKLPERSTIKVLPLLLVHGWPGSVVEFHKIIPMLTTPQGDRDFVFEVIVPSIPGFGYSDAPAKIGLTDVATAHLFKNFMVRLGFNQWYTQAGDWGAIVTAQMAAIYPEHTLGMHSNFCLVINAKAMMKLVFYSLFPSLLEPEERPHVPPITDTVSEALSFSGYLHEQATKPDTLGVGLTDSPAGLSTWLLEKVFGNISPEVHSTSPDKLLQVFTMDELLDDVMLYWAPNKIASTFRTYAETLNTHAQRYNADSVPIKVPSACAQFPYDIFFMPEKVLSDRYVNLVHRKIMPRGGHFAAWQEPKLLADDVFEAVGKMRYSGSPDVGSEKKPNVVTNIWKNFKNIF